ncbi:hypothetical protein [Bacillus salipaludis]|uniref:Uncharacterized protein n=1 Tax=Bacillus salipaludis TaxID=2547811 RepID=A0AA90TMU8_9BACI|nr:hypothetical protein [Bacillus salipaludis]MDQ6594901.1 hypothetical protein [Bacillus salipaludis]
MYHPYGTGHIPYPFIGTHMGYGYPLSLYHHYHPQHPYVHFGHHFPYFAVPIQAPVRFLN